MSLKESFARKAIKGYLEKKFTNIKIGPLTYRPEMLEEVPTIGLCTSVARFGAEFTAVSKKDGTKVEGRVGYAPHFNGGSAYSHSSRPA